MHRPASSEPSGIVLVAKVISAAMALVIATTFIATSPQTVMVPVVIALIIGLSAAAVAVKTEAIVTSRPTTRHR
jgi:ABC-type amino acid transport system permease subunit